MSRQKKIEPATPFNRILRRPEVLGMTGLAKSTLYDYLASGTFPAPVKLSTRSVGWMLNDVVEWINSRKRTR